MDDRIVTTEVAAFTADRGIEIAAAIEHAVRRAMLDSVGVSVAGTRHPASQKVIEMIAGLD